MPTPEETVIEALALSPAGLTQTQLHHLLRKGGVRIAGKKPTAAAARALLDDMPDLRHDGRRYTVEAPDLVDELARSGRMKAVLDAVAEVEPYSDDRFASSPIHVARREMLRALLGRDDERVVRLIPKFQARAFDDVEAFVLYPFRDTLVGAMTPLGQVLCVEHGLHLAVHRAVPVLDDIERLVAENPAFRATGRARLAAARVAFLRGDVALARERAGTQLQDRDAGDLLGALALLEGDVDGSCKRYAPWLAEARQMYGPDIVPITEAALLLPLAYLLSNKKSRVKQALKLIDRAQQRGWMGPDMALGGWDALRCLADPKHVPKAVEHPIGRFFPRLVLAWRGQDDPDRDRVIFGLRVRGLSLFADELAAGEDGRIARLRETRAAWKDALDALSKALKATPAPEADRAEARLAWTLYVADPPKLYLEARVQKRTSKGWSKGRKVAADRLHAGGDSSLPWTPADRAVARGLRLRHHRGYRGYTRTEESWRPAATWRGLVGHPAVFDRHGEPLRVIGRSPTLEVVEHDGGRLVRVSPPVGPSGVSVERVGKDWEVVLVQDAQKAAIEVIGQGLVFPERAAGQLDALLEKAEHVFPRAHATAAVQEGDARVHLFLTPRGNALLVELGVLPAGPDGPRAVPGRGSALLLAVVNGQGARVRRDLSLERTWLALARELPGLADAEPDEPVLLELDLALDLLAEASAREVPLLWPEGGALRITRPAKGARVTVSSAADWFEASGSLQTEDGDQVSLAELARQLLRSRRRFLALEGGAYLELTERIRDQLDLLARAGDIRGDRIRVHPLATSALVGLLDAEAATADPDTHSRLRGQRTPSRPEDVPPGLKAELRPYQLDAYRWLCSLAAMGAGGILADDMGLGKTVTALALLLRRRGEGPALVVAPTSVVGNWLSETTRFAPDLMVWRMRDLDGLPETLGPGDLVVCTYGLLIHRIASLVDTTWSTVVFDESQALKNDSTQRHQAALRLQARMRLALTGTPIENHLGELHAQLNVVNPGLLGSRKRFDARFTRPIEEGDRAVQRGLKALVQPFLLRRTKAAVLQDLPPRTDKNLLITLGEEERVLYEAERTAALAALEDAEAGAIDVLGRLSRLRQLACSPELVVPGYQGESAKTRAFRRLSRDFVEAGHRTLVFSQFVRHLAVLRRVLDDAGHRYLYLDGSTPARQRSERVDAFQRGDASFFLVSLKAGGTGLNLTAADYVLHMDPWWNPAVEDQASDRAHRYGQQRPVTVYRLIAEGTVEERIVELHRSKRDLADQILSGTDTAKRLSTEELLGLLREGG